MPLLTRERKATHAKTLVPVRDDERVREAGTELLRVRADLHEAEQEFLRCRSLVDSNYKSQDTPHVSEEDVIRARLAFPDVMKTYYQLQLQEKVQAQKVEAIKQQVTQELIPILEEKLRVAVVNRQKALEAVVPLNEAVYEIVQQAEEVFGGDQSKIPNLTWPEFRSDQHAESTFDFRTKQYRDMGWLE